MEIKRRRHIRRKKRSRSQSNQGNPLSKGQLARKERRFLSNPGTWKTLERKPEGSETVPLPIQGRVSPLARAIETLPTSFER